MKALILSIVALAAGCQPAVTPQQRDLMVQCMVQAAIGVNHVDHVKREPSPKPSGCCKECNNTGKVLSGDGISKVDCECPATCTCKAQRRQKSETDSCPRCLGLGKVLDPDGKRITKCDSCGGCADCSLTK
jgi:hypothetical protein